MAEEEIRVGLSLGGGVCHKNPARYKTAYVRLGRYDCAVQVQFTKARG